MSPPTIACLPRSPENLKIVLDSLKVMTTPKYLPEDLNNDGKKETKCNWFVSGACELLDAHLPKGLRAREQIQWLGSPDGRLENWFECILKEDADAHAALGHAVVVGWTNPDPKAPSHVAMLRSPGRICQAGAKNYNDALLSYGFGNRAVRYFCHL